MRPDRRGPPGGLEESSFGEADARPRAAARVRRVSASRPTRSRTRQSAAAPRGLSPARQGHSSRSATSSHTRPSAVQTDGSSGKRSAALARVRTAASVRPQRAYASPTLTSRSGRVGSSAASASSCSTASRRRPAALVEIDQLLAHGRERRADLQGARQRLLVPLRPRTRSRRHMPRR